MDGSGITLRGELVQASPAGLVLRTRDGQIIEVPATAIQSTSMEEDATVVDLASSAQLVIRAPDNRDWILDSGVFGRLGDNLFNEDGGDGGGGGGNCNCNCSGGNCNCNCNCNSITQVGVIAELPRLRRQLR